jgi:hypothetical protein
VIPFICLGFSNREKRGLKNILKHAATLFKPPCFTLAAAHSQAVFPRRVYSSDFNGSGNAEDSSTAAANTSEVMKMTSHGQGGYRSWLAIGIDKNIITLPLT